MTYREDVRDVAYAAAIAKRQGKTTYKPYADAETMDLIATGWCTRLVRQVHEAAMHSGAFTWPYRAADARALEVRLKGAGKRVNKPQPGDIVCMNGTSHPKGHVGIYVGYCLPDRYPGVEFIVHNTSGKWGGWGPGTVFTPLSRVKSIVSGYYATLPSRPLPEKLTVRIEGQEPIDCHPVEENGVTRADLRPLVEALGYSITELPPRITLKKRGLTS